MMLLHTLQTKEEGSEPAWCGIRLRRKGTGYRCSMCAKLFNSTTSMTSLKYHLQREHEIDHDAHDIYI
jgi:tRNA(Ile2) C34 agmatinyltransferase TiaS